MSTLLRFLKRDGESEFFIPSFILFDPDSLLSLQRIPCCALIMLNVDVSLLNIFYQTFSKLEHTGLLQQLVSPQFNYSSPYSSPWTAFKIQNSHEVAIFSKLDPFDPIPVVIIIGPHLKKTTIIWKKN